MPDKVWKRVERDVAAYFGGERRGADFRDESGGKNDILKEGYSIEVKHRKSPRWGEITAAVKQAKDAAEPGDIACAVIHQKGSKIKNSLVVMTLEDFIDWFVNESER